MRARLLSIALLVAALAGCKATVSMPDNLDFSSAARDMARPPVDLAEADLAQAGDVDMAMVTDGPAPDLEGADMTAPPDLSQADAPPADMAVAMADLAMRDLATPDLAMADLAMPDLARPVDFAGADLACAMACNTPPPSTCMANVIVSYGQNGACVNGACAYPPMMTTCMYGCYKAACSAALSFIGNTAAFQTGTGTQVGLFNGTAPAGNTVSAITQTFPHGAAKAVHLIYSLNDPMFKNPVDLVMQADPNAPMGNNDQWFAIIPKQQAGTKVIWYLRADPYTGNSLYDSGNGQNFTYTTQ